jgi:uncharacterized membrane protein YfcA
MTLHGFTILVWLGSLTAGFLGALTGLGGGVVLVPMLTLLFGVDIRYAIGASLVSVIATSSGAAAAYVKEGFTNIRIGMLLEIATPAGAIGGAMLAAHVPTKYIAIIFGVVLIYSAYQSLSDPALAAASASGDRLAHFFKLNGDYPTAEGKQEYQAEHVPAGFSIMLLAGVISGLLGIGSGALKVIAMDRAMKIPFKVSTTTSNFMIGVTAAASAGVYLSRGYIAPGLAWPVMLGVLSGALLGARVLVRARVRILRYVFAAVICAMAVEMIFSSRGAGNM